jgi:hypothetical protein
VASGTLVATILRPARIPKGTEARTVIKHVAKRLTPAHAGLTDRQTMRHVPHDCGQ